MSNQDVKQDEPNIRQNLKQPGIWIRALYMILFCIIYGIAEMVIFAVVIIQFLLKLFTTRTNTHLLSLGQSLGTYVYQILLFLMFNSDRYPYPFSEWPKGPPDDRSGGTGTPENEIRESLTDLQDYNDGD